MANTQPQSEQPQSAQSQTEKPQLLSLLLGSTLTQITWFILRLSAGGLMIHNGFDKLTDVQGFADGVVSFIGLPYPVFFTYCAAYTEIIGSILIFLGLLVRPSAGALLVTMAIAVFFHLKANGLAIAPLETATLYATIYTFLLINGAGQWSLDEWLANRLGDD
ncbi:MAG: DoxX family protein [Cyanobacteria bacterium P01_F01_bin.53]